MLHFFYIQYGQSQIAYHLKRHFPMHVLNI